MQTLSSKLLDIFWSKVLLAYINLKESLFNRNDATKIKDVLVNTRKNNIVLWLWDRTVTVYEVMETFCLIYSRIHFHQWPRKVPNKNILCSRKPERGPVCMGGPRPWPDGRHYSQGPVPSPVDREPKLLSSTRHHHIFSDFVPVTWFMDGFNSEENCFVVFPR